MYLQHFQTFIYLTEIYSKNIPLPPVTDGGAVNNNFTKGYAL